MKIVKLVVSFLLVAITFYALNTKIGSIPPLGKFLAPSTGFWQNEKSELEIEELDIAGLQDEVRVYIDEFRIPHIFANNDHDLAMAQGYITAMDRLWQMEFQTHAAAGRISEIIGEDALEYDRGQRRKGMVFGAENSLKIMNNNPQSQQLVDAYTSGVNQYIDNLEANDYPIEYKLLDYAPESWTNLKVGLLLMYMTDMLAGGDSDLEYSNFLNKFGRDRFDFIYPDFYDVNDPIIPADKDWSDLNATSIDTPRIELPRDSIKDIMEKPHPDNGSNNWAVAPSKSYSGNAILANDPHLGLNLPSIWYVMQLTTPDQNAFGATLPGVLGVISGFNNYIAWGETNATRDLKDWYKIEFKDKKRDEYKYNNTWKKSNKRLEAIKIRNGETYTDTVVYTHHGPVSYDHTFKGNNQKLGYAMTWIGHVGGDNQKTFLDLNKAKNYDDYVNAIKHYVAPAQNFVFASTEGDIALWIQGLFPNKWKGQGKFLMDGSKPENDWNSFIPQSHNAYIKNPKRGFVSSANQHPVDKSYPYYVFNDGYETYRNRVINDFFRSKDKFNIEDFKDLQNNNYNLKAAELLPTMISIIDKSQLSEQELVTLNIVADWKYFNEIDQIGPSIWESWWGNIYDMLWDEFEDDELALDFPFAYRTIEMIKNSPQDEFMDIVSTPEKETAKDLILKSFKLAHKDLEKFRDENGEYNWGDYKATYIGHLLQALPAFSRFNLPIGGNRSIVNATSKNHGPSWRMIVEMSSPPKALGVYPGGQSGNPGSKYYDNFVDMWAKGEYLSLNFLQDEPSTDSMAATLTLRPLK